MRGDNPIRKHRKAKYRQAGQLGAKILSYNFISTTSSYQLINMIQLFSCYLRVFTITSVALQQQKLNVSINFY